MNYGRQVIYDLERDSIRAFVASHRFEGRVLDYGAGLQPYRELVERTAEYVAWDRADYPANVSGVNVGAEPWSSPWDSVLCTQVIQYAPWPMSLAMTLKDLLKPGGALVLTGPGCWHEQEPEFLQSFTRAGIRHLLKAALFTVERVDDRATLDLGGFPISLGWGAVARA